MKKKIIITCSATAAAVVIAAFGLAIATGCIPSLRAGEEDAVQSAQHTDQSGEKSKSSPESRDTKDNKKAGESSAAPKKEQNSKARPDSSSKEESKTSENSGSSDESSAPEEKTPEQEEHEPEQEKQPSYEAEVSEQSHDPEPVNSTAEEQQNTSPVPERPTDDNGLISYLSGTGYSVGALNVLGCRQLITVDSYGSEAELSFYRVNSDGVWEKVSDLDTYGYVGSNGASYDSCEGSYETPCGLFRVGDAFYIDDVPQTSLNMFRVTEDTYWVDDPSSVYYNTRVEGTANKDWNSAEHMIDYYSSYRYGFVIEFNTDNIIPGKGSAIFFHISYSPTAGCVGITENMVLQYLSILDSAKHPYIIIK